MGKKGVGDGEEESTWRRRRATTSRRRRARSLKRRRWSLPAAERQACRRRCGSLKAGGGRQYGGELPGVEHEREGRGEFVLGVLYFSIWCVCAHI
jgi:hypothetical protein